MGAADDPAPPPSLAAFNIPLNPQHLQTFLAVVEAGGRLSAAAKQIGMSQPGVTHQLNELERRLNVKLLDRARGRAARMTRAGRLFARYARSILELQGSMFAELEGLARQLGGHLRVGASPGPGEHWLPPLLCDFRRANPHLQVELHVTDARSIVELVFNSDLELGFVGGRWSRAGLRFDPVASDEFVLIAAADHPLAIAEGLLLRELEGAELVLQEPGTGLRTTFEQELADRALTLSHFSILAELGNQESVKAAVMAGNGIGCVWRGSIAAELALGRLAVLDVADFQPDSNFYAVRRRNRQLTLRAQSLLEYLEQEIDDESDPEEHNPSAR